MREAVLRGRSGFHRELRGLLERRGDARLSRPALHGLDVKLDAIIDRDGGFFIEAGANDGYTQSNTYFLERFRGWRGILVEPMPELAAEARRNRPDATVFECALVGTDYQGADIEMEFGDLMTTVRGLHDGQWAEVGLTQGWREPRVERVPARRLSELLDELDVRSIDLLSLDVEGYEAVALQGLDLDRHAPDWILIEMHDLSTGRAAMSEVLGQRYTEHAQLSPMDVLYRRVSTTPSPEHAD